MSYGIKSAGEEHGHDLAEVNKKLSTVLDQVKNFGEDIQAKMKVGQTVSDELKQKTDEALGKMGELSELATKLQTRVGDLEQKLDRTDETAHDVPKSIGQLVVESDAYKSMDSAARKSIRVQMDRKAITSFTPTVGAGASATTSLVVGDRVAGIIAPPNRQMTIRNLVAPGSTSSNSVEYVVETGFTNSAAPVREDPTQAKPQSNLTFNLKTAPVRTIAHIFKASRQILDDAQGLASYIDARARYGLQYAEELQLLAGNGSGQNILGILPQATAYSAPFSPTLETPIDRLRLAILQAALAEYPVTGIVLHPTDWTRVELTKDGEGRYIIAQPQGTTQPTLWNLPVVSTQAIGVDTFLVGAFAMAAQVFDRQNIEVLISTENEDDFVKNMVTIRAEERLALAVYRPEAFITGSVTGSGT